MVEEKMKRGCVVYLLVIVSVGLNFFLYHQLIGFRETKGKYEVVEVLDGDSFVVDLDQTIRLTDLDAPNMGRCLSEEAKRRLEELVLGKYVEIEAVGKDEFKRTIALVYVDGQLVNEVMVREGLAKYLSGGSREKELVRQVAEEAKEKALGVWSPKCYQKENTENPDCLIKGNIGKHDRVKVYHLPGCSEYNRTVVELDLGEEWFCTEEEAKKAGYRKSEHCFD